MKLSSLTECRVHKKRNVMYSNTRAVTDGTFMSSPKFTCWNNNSQCDGVRRWGFGEVLRWWGWSPHERGGEWRRRRQRALSFQSCDDTARRWPTVNRPSPDTQSATALILGSLASRTAQHKFLLFSYPVYGILLHQLGQTKTLGMHNEYMPGIKQRKK